MGSLVAVECAVRHAARLERIALLGTAYPMKVGEAFLEAAKKNETTAFDMSTIWGHAPQVPLGGNPNPGMWMYGDNLARLHNALLACHQYAGGEAGAVKTSCPVLFILGSRDQMTAPRVAAGFASSFKVAQTVLLPPSGHSMMAEAPDATLDALAGFLNQN